METHGVSPGWPMFTCRFFFAPCFRVQIACWVDEFFIFRPHAKVWAHIALIVLPWVEDWRFWRLQYTTMKNNEGICTVYKTTKGSQLGHFHGQATSHWSLAFLCTLQKPLSHVVPVCKECTVDWVYLRILWHTASCFSVSHRFRPSLWMYTELRNSSTFHVHIPCDTMSSWLIPQPSARICLELGQALTVRCTRNMREGTSELHGMEQISTFINLQKLYQMNTKWWNLDIFQWLKILPNWKIHIDHLQNL